MRISAIFLCFLLLASSHLWVAHATETRIAVQLRVSSDVCLTEDVKIPDSTVFIHFMVSVGYPAQISFLVKNPNDRLVYSVDEVVEDRVVFHADTAGRYLICFGNRHVPANEKVLSLNVATFDPVTKGKKKNKMDSMTAALNRVNSRVSSILDLQQYIRTRERDHRNLVKRANSQVLWYGIAEVLVIAGFSYFNVSMVRRKLNVRRFV